MRLRKYFGLLLIAGLLIGCTPQVQKIAEDIRPAKLSADYYLTADGVDLPLKSWQADKPAKAVIIAVHGFNDYRNGFAFPASWWMQRGITTYAYDQRGFGETAYRGIWAGTDRLKKDLAVLVDLVRDRHPDVPLYLLGESMGGAVVMASAREANFPKVDGLILSAPAVWGWQSLNGFYRAALWCAAHLVPSMTASGNGLGIQASDNISMLQNLGRDSYFIKQTRIDSVYGLVGLMDQAYNSAEKLDLPTLVLYGAQDEVIPKDPVEDVVARLPKTADIVLYEDGWHLLMRDLQAPLVWRDIDRWITDREIPSGHQVQQLPLFAKQ